MKSSLTAFCLLPLLATAAGASAGAATVTELKPSEVAAFVARHEYAIVQVTSPDRRCGYCIGADRKFDKVAAAAGDRKFAFARVQYSPWRSIPDFGKLMTVYGVPAQFVFRNGKAVGDVGIYYETPATFYPKVDAVLAGPVAPAPVPEPPPKAEPAPLAAGEAAALRLYIRHDALRGIAEECGKRFPAGAAGYRAAVARWREGHQDELGKGAMLMLQGRGDAKALFAEEMKAIEAWQTSELGIPRTKRVEAADCDRFAAGLAALP